MSVKTGRRDEPPPRKRSRVTSFDVARRARVSRTTVSFVLNGIVDSKISEKTKARVLKAARELAYVPDAAAKALVRRRSENIGLVYTRSYHHMASNSFFLRLMDGLMQFVHERGLRLVIDSIDGKPADTNLLRLARAKHIDGLILLEPRKDDPQLAALARERFPVVLIGSAPSIEVCSIDIDNTDAAFQAVTYLIAQGHRRIGCITNAPLSFTAATARLAGYRQALRENGIPYDPTLVGIGRFHPESGYLAMRALLDTGKAPTAVFVASDTVALGSIRAITERRLRIPDDIAVFGFDNIVESSYTTPPLSTMSFPVEEHGKRSGELLLEVMGGGVTSPRHMTTPVQMVIRESTAVRRGRQNATENRTADRASRGRTARAKNIASSSNWRQKQSEEVSI